MTQVAFMPRHIAFDHLDAEGLATELAEHGSVYVDGIPEEFDHAQFLGTHLGPLMPQYDGELIWSIKATPGFDDVYHSLNTKRLTPHTECYEWQDTPPKYLALWCLVPNFDQGGQTTLADGRAFLDTLDTEERELLRTRTYHYVSSAGLQQMKLGLSAHHPVLEERAGREPILRFTCQCIADADAFCKDISRRLQEFFEKNKAEIDFTPRSLLIWDNHRILHSRNAFSDPERHLRRVWIAEQ